MQVTNLSELQAALAAATGGERITLAPGQYGKLTLPAGTGAAWSAPVTIISEARRAVFSGLDLKAVENMRFESLSFVHDWANGPRKTFQAFQWQSCRNIVVRDCLFQGATATTGPAPTIGHASGKGPGFGRCDGVLFGGNEVRGFYLGVSIGGCDNVQVIANDVHSMRSDGFRINGVKNLLMELNHIHDFRRAPGTGDHADFIQFSTSGATRPSENVIIRDNLLDRAGGDTTQSIFMRNERVDRGQAGIEMFYRNLLIEHNTIRNNHLHGITVGEADGLTIIDNVLESVGPSKLRKNIPRINTKKVSLNVVISGNTIIPQA